MSESERQTSPPPAFSEAYYRARKSYGLFSALLLAWSLVGVTVGDTPVENIKVSLKSPQAAPYVLVVLVAYFAFRMCVEWYQTDTTRRALKASGVDYFVAHAIGVASGTLFVGQLAAGFQLADIVTMKSFLAFGVGAALAMMVGIVIGRARTGGWREGGAHSWKIDGTMLVAFVPFVAYGLDKVFTEGQWIAFFLGCLGGGSAVLILMRPWRPSV